MLDPPSFNETKMVTTRSGRMLPYVKNGRQRRNILRSLAETAKTAAIYYAGRSSVKTEPGTRTRENLPLTGQFDYKTDYRKRRLTKRKRRYVYRKRRFARRIIRTIRNANTATTHLVRNSVFRSSSAQNTSNALCYGLNGLDGYGANDDVDTCNDISEFLKEKDPTNWNAWDTNATRNYKLWVMHATQELTIRNTGQLPCIVEAYYFRGKRPVRAAYANTPKALYLQSFTKMPRAQDPDTGALYDTALTFDRIGTTPFQAQQFCQNCTVYKRQKFQLPSGADTNIIIHSRGHTFSVADTKLYSFDRRYHGVFLQYQGLPQFDSLATPPYIKATNAEITVLSVRRYRCKFIDNSGAAQGAFETTD